MIKKILLITLSALSLWACQPKEPQTKVYGRYVPERKDDFAWENEYAAFRLYGPALLPENPSNGVDLWLKASPELVVDSFYYREHVLGLPYHINYGAGLDCYKVAHTTGCGGLAVVADSTLFVGGPYSTWEIIEQTPTKLVFRLGYDSLSICDQIMQGTLTITAEAGKLLNKAEVVINCRTRIRLPQLYAGGGIYLHDSIDHIMYGIQNGVIAYAENALSDPAAAQMNYDYNGATDLGRSYAAVVTPHATRREIIDGTLLSLREYTCGDTLTYYFGGCWSQWSNGGHTMSTDNQWFEAVNTFAAE
ncbi:MAG: DUF4861 family protein [Paludibacteraceae bacterium]